MKSSKEKNIKRPVSRGKKIMLCLLGIVALAALVYLIYYLFHYVWYDRYKVYVTGYEYETGTVYSPALETNPDVAGMELVCENEYLKLYTDTKTANIAVYDKRNGTATYSNPVNADENGIANGSNLNYLKSQLLVGYYNSDVKAGTYDSYSQSVAKGQFSMEGIENGIRYIYQIGDMSGANDATIWFEIPLEYRLEKDGLTVSIPACGIEEHGNAGVFRIQMLRYMGAADNTETGYMVVPNGSGSLIYFNNGKVAEASYSQYVFDIDPLASTFTTLENVDSAKLPLFGICREDRSLLATVEDGATTALITAGISGVYNDYNYAYPTFVLRNIDNLRMFGNATQDVFVMEPELYDINMEVRYSFLTQEQSGYVGIADYYRSRLRDEGALTASEESGDIPFYYDIISGVKETSHFLGVQYLHTFSMTTFEEAGLILEDLAASGIHKQVMNLQGWFNGGYYHDAADRIRVVRSLGGKSGLEELNAALADHGGSLYADVDFQRITFADDGYNYNAESSRYYGAGYVAGFGQVNPITLHNTSSLRHYETMYDLLSPKFLPRYVEKFEKSIRSYDVDGISLRDLGNVVYSDKKRTNIINREEALDVVLGQLDTLDNTKKLMTNAANSYSFPYSSDIINVPIEHNKFAIVDESIPLYEMILHGSISYASELLNYQDKTDMPATVLKMIEAGAAPHYVFTWEQSSKMKNTGLNRYYATTYSVWREEAVAVYKQVNDALKHVSGAVILNHEVLDGGVRKVTYDNGVRIYLNYAEEDRQADGMELPPMSYRVEGI